MEDIITIESAISETQESIDRLSGSLQHYDSMVDYATVYINLNEVYQLSTVQETPAGFAQRLGNAFAGGWRGIFDRDGEPGGGSGLRLDVDFAAGGDRGGGDPAGTAAELKAARTDETGRQTR